MSRFLSRTSRPQILFSTSLLSNPFRKYARCILAAGVLHFTGLRVFDKISVPAGFSHRDENFVVYFSSAMTLPIRR